MIRIDSIALTHRLCPVFKRMDSNLQTKGTRYTLLDVTASNFCLCAHERHLLSRGFLRMLVALLKYDGFIAQVENGSIVCYRTTSTMDADDLIVTSR
jgi:hypothetical protein